MTDKFLQLQRLLTRGMHNGKMFTLECSNAFEGHGRASETWETHYYLTLPDIPSFRRFNGNWILNEGRELPMQFHTRTAEEAIDQAITFLTQSGARQKSLMP